MAQDIIKEKLLDKNYYLSKLSMFMKESYGISPQVDLMLDWMKDINSGSNYLLNILNIWDEEYKNEMIESFGRKYVARARTETPINFRGKFSSPLSGEVDCSNVYVQVGNEIYDDIVYTDVSMKEFLARQSVSEEATFVEDSEAYEGEYEAPYYVYYTEGDSFVLKTADCTTANGGEPLYVYDVHENIYIEAELPQVGNFEDRMYYLNTNGEIATPYNLKLFKNKACMMKYEVLKDLEGNPDYAEKNPGQLKMYDNENNNLFKVTTDSNFDDEKFYYKLILDQNQRVTSVVRCSPSYLNLYESVNVLTKDEDFIHNKPYYLDSSCTQRAYPTNADGGNALVETQPNPSYATGTFDLSKVFFIEVKGMYKDKTIFPDDPGTYHKAYQVAKYYNYFQNLYYDAIKYDFAKNTGEGGNFSSSTVYFMNKNYEDATPQNSNLDGGILYDSVNHQTSDTSFDRSKTYYIDSACKFIASPLTLNLFEGANHQRSYDDTFKLSSETSLLKNYYILKQAMPKNADNGSPLYTYYNRAYHEATEDVFDDNTVYYKKITNRVYEIVTPQSLSLKIMKIDKCLCEYNAEIEQDFFTLTYYTNEDFFYKEYNENNPQEMYDTIEKFTSAYDYADNYVEETNINAKDFLFLDVIANIVGCSRNNVIKQSTFNQINKKWYTTYIKVDPLSNEDLLDLIKIKIIQNNYQGTMEELIDLYENKLKYSLYICLESDNNQEEASYRPASCIVYLADFKTDGELITKSMRELFRYSDLFIQSMGISYNKALVSDLDSLLILDKDYGYKGQKAIYGLGEVSENDPDATRLG